MIRSEYIECDAGCGGYVGDMNHNPTSGEYQLCVSRWLADNYTDDDGVFYDMCAGITYEYYSTEAEALARKATLK